MNNTTIGSGLLGESVRPVMAMNNIIIVCVGLGILILPVIGALIWVCAHKRVFHHLRLVAGVKNNGMSDASLPYSRFGARSGTLGNTVHQDVCREDNGRSKDKTATTNKGNALTPTSRSDSDETLAVVTKPVGNHFTAVIVPDCIDDTAATFVVPSHPSARNNATRYSPDSDLKYYDVM